jgi:hypothetical protein
MENMQSRDEPADQVRSRVEQLGVYDDLRTLAGWQRAFVFEALSVAHCRDLEHHDGTLAGARYLQDMADVRAKVNSQDPLVAVLNKAATAMVHV